jgi:hypothetical protein
MTLLTESTRRVGTAWPAAVSRGDYGEGKAWRKIRGSTFDKGLIFLTRRPRNDRFERLTAVTPQFIPARDTQG